MAEAARFHAPSPVGRVIWITGLSGAGKTTVAQVLVTRLRASGGAVAHLDGDQLRAVYGEDCGHGEADRRRIAARHGRLSLMLADQGLDVVCSTISMYRAQWDWNRAHIARYVEIYLRVPGIELARRDPKGLYRDAGAPMVGRELAVEEPLGADLVIDNHGAIAAADAAYAIFRHLQHERPNPQ